MSPHARALLVASILSAGCGGTPTETPDAGPVEIDSGGVAPFQWASAPDYPIGIAFGSAMVLPADGTRYVYVFGGASGSYFDLGTFYSDVRRAEILADHSLGPWEDAGTMSTGSSPITLAGHDAIRIRSELGEDGVAIAGGGVPASALPLILVGYVDATSGSVTSWGRFDPMLDEGQWYASWDAFEPHHFALVGGEVAGAPTDRVRIGVIENGSMSPTFLVGPSLPTARFGHGSAVLGGEVYVVGGAGAGGVLNEVLRTTRDDMGHVNGWTSAGELSSRVVFPSAVATDDALYVIGGIVSDPQSGPASVRVLGATVGAGGGLGTVAAIEEAQLPEPLAASLVAESEGYVYVIGGISAGDAASAGSHVYWARLP